MTSNGSKPIKVLTRTKSSGSDDRLPLGYLLPNFERFLVIPLSARLILVHFVLTEYLTSNGSKPIRVLTRTISSCSDERLPIRYSLPDF